MARGPVQESLPRKLGLFAKEGQPAWTDRHLECQQGRHQWERACLAAACLSYPAQEHQACPGYLARRAVHGAQGGIQSYSTGPELQAGNLAQAGTSPEGEDMAYRRT